MYGTHQEHSRCSLSAGAGSCTSGTDLLGRSQGGASGPGCAPTGLEGQSSVGGAGLWVSYRQGVCSGCRCPSLWKNSIFMVASAWRRRVRSGSLGQTLCQALCPQRWAQGPSALIQPQPSTVEMSAGFLGSARPGPGPLALKLQKGRGSAWLACVTFALKPRSSNRGLQLCHWAAMTSSS